MPLYTIRVRLGLPTVVQRGASYAEQSYHFAWDGDGAAVAALDDLASAWHSSGISSRWTAVRDYDAHSIDLYRRDIGDRRSWTHLAGKVFRLARLGETSITIPIGEGEVSVTVRERPLWPHQRGAVLVRERAVDRRIQRRTYVGPLSPMAYQGVVPLLAGFASIWAPSAYTGDYPYDPESDSIDLWRDDIRDLARDHVANLEERAGDGYSVIPSWTHGTISPVVRVAASTVRAEVRSRSLRYPMGPPTD